MHVSDAQRAERWALFLFLLLPIVRIPGLHDAWLTPKILVWLGGMAVLVAIAPGAQFPRWSIWALVFFTLAILISTYRARFPFEALTQAAVYVAWIVWCGLLVILFREEITRRRFNRLIVLHAVLQAVIGFVQLFFVRRYEKMLVLGTFGNPDFVAAWLAPAFVLCAFGTDRPERRKRILLAIIGAGLLATGSRGAFLAMVISAGLFLRGWKRPAVIGVGSAAVAALIAWHPHSFFGRLHLWSSAFQMIADSHGLGVGLGHFKFHFFEMQRRLFESGSWDRFASNASMAVSSHSDALDFLADGGVFLFISWILFVCGVLTAIRRNLDNNEIRALGAAVFAVFIHGLFSFPLHVVPNLVLTGVLAAQIFSISQPGGYEVRTMRLGWTAAVIALFLVVCGVRVGVKEIVLTKATIDLAHGRAGRSQATLRRSLDFYPNDSDISCYLARLLCDDLRYEEALSLLQRLHGVAESVDSWKLEGQILMSLKRWDDALAVYGMLEKTFPLHVTPKYQLGRIYDELGLHNEAAHMYEAALRVEAVSEKGRAEQVDASERLRGRTAPIF